MMNTRAQIVRQFPLSKYRLITSFISVQFLCLLGSFCGICTIFADFW